MEVLCFFVLIAIPNFRSIDVAVPDCEGLHYRSQQQDWVHELSVP